MNNNVVTVPSEQIEPVGEQPDPDNIKMFVGQVPRSMDENDLRELFEEFGRVHQINVLRDKATGASKGKLIISLSTFTLLSVLSNKILLLYTYKE